MRFDIITIFPHIFDSYFNESILKRAQEADLIKIEAHDLRRWADDKHKKVDDSPYGGGPGMVFKVEPIYKAVKELKSSKFQVPSSKMKRRVILFSAKGKQFNQADARRLAKYNQLILICGRYEGVDERVAEHIADEELSVGNFVLTGGEIPAMIMVDAVSRLIPGVLGKEESLVEESFSNPPQPSLVSGTGQALKGGSRKTDSPFLGGTGGDFEDNYLEYPQYTRPEKFKSWKVPQVLLSGNHKKINDWKEKQRKIRKYNFKF